MALMATAVARAVRAATQIILPPLPYSETLLEPVISANTLGFHYGKHHRSYVDNLNRLIPGTEFADATLEQIVVGAAGEADTAAMFDDAAQAWNHTFYWNSMKPEGGGEPPAALKQKIEALIRLPGCVPRTCNGTTTQFGSGWAWLVQDSGKLKVVKTGNAECLTKE